MVPMAPYALRRYLRELTPQHEVVVDDLNARYHRHLWNEAYSDEIQREFRAAGMRPAALQAELVERFGPLAFSSLRDAGTYRDAALVRRHHMVLHMALTLQLLHTRELCGAARLPAAYGGWTELLDKWRRTLLGRYLERQIADGAFDGCDAVGLSALYMEQVAPSLLLARLLKARSPQLKIIIGGGAITHLLSELRQDRSFFDFIDYAVPFEGEEVLGTLVGGTDPEVPLANVVYVRRGEVYYAAGERGPVIQSIADYSGLEHLYPTPEPIYSVLTAKDCYWGKCAYCTHHEGYSQGYKPMADTQVVKTLNDLIDTGARAFYFVDEALPPRRLSLLAETFGAAVDRGKAVAWLAESRVERALLNPEAVERLQRSGCRLLVSGIESGSQAISERMQKGIDLELVARHARLCHERGIRVGWMFFIGFPGETATQARETFRFIAANAESLEFAVVGTFSLERGSPIWSAPADFGVRDIVDRKAPYRLSFTAVMADGETRPPGALAQQLDDLHEEFLQLRPLFDGAIDRSLLFFLRAAPLRATNETLADQGVLRFEWRSAAERATIHYDAGRGDLELRRVAATAEKPC